MLVDSQAKDGTTGVYRALDPHMRRPQVESCQRWRMKSRFALVVLVTIVACRSPEPAAPAPVTSAAPPPTVLFFRLLAIQSQGVVLTSFTLTMDGTRATLDLRSKDTPLPADGATSCEDRDGKPIDCKPNATLELWSDEAGGAMTGTVQKSSNGIALDFERPDPDSPHLEMSCAEQLFDVAPATAVLLEDSNCAPLTWSMATERVRLLTCTSNSSDPTVFGPSPGIERVHFRNAGCGDRAPAFRRIAADRSVARAVQSL